MGLPARAIRTAGRRLDSNTRDAILAARIGGMKLMRIAKAFGVSVSTVHAICCKGGA